MSYNRQSTAIQRQEELKQRLDKLNSKQTPKNVFKKLPGYGSAWVYRNIDSRSTADGQTSSLQPSQVTAFVKKLRTRPPPEDLEEDMEHVIQGPGFEFPTDKEAAKSVKHWAKRFKHWQPSLPSSSTPAPVLKIKAPSSNEIEIDGKRWRKVDAFDEKQSLLKSGVVLMHRRKPSPNEARFMTEVFKDDDVECRFVVSKDSSEEQLKEMLNNYAVTKIYAPTSLVTTLKTEIEKRGNEIRQSTAAATRLSPVIAFQDRPSPRP